MNNDPSGGALLLELLVPGAGLRILSIDDVDARIREAQERLDRSTDLLLRRCSVPGCGRIAHLAGGPPTRSGRPTWKACYKHVEEVEGLSGHRMETWTG